MRPIVKKSARRTAAGGRPNVKENSRTKELLEAKSAAPKNNFLFRSSAPPGLWHECPLSVETVPQIQTDMMKPGKFFSLKALVVAVMLALANQSHALYTNFLDGVVMLLDGEYHVLTNLHAPTPAQKVVIREIKSALRDLSKPSASVAGDYNLFFAAAAHLGPLIHDPVVNAAGTNAANLFIAEAGAEYIGLAGRLAMLDDFVPAKKGRAISCIRRTGRCSRCTASPTSSRLCSSGG